MTHPIALWHHIVTHRDPGPLAELLADDVVFHSPVVHTPQVGKRITRLYLIAAMKVLGNETFRYVREIVGDGQAVLEFRVEIDGVEINGIDLLTWNAEGRLTEFKVMVRPLQAIQKLHEKMAERMSAGAS